MKRTDFAVINCGTIFLLHPLTQDADNWSDEHLPEDALRSGNAYAVEHRYIEDIVSGLIADGLTVR